jgi:hypothetical protein
MRCDEAIEAPARPRPWIFHVEAKTLLFQLNLCTSVDIRQVIMLTNHVIMDEHYTSPSNINV